MRPLEGMDVVWKGLPLGKNPNAPAKSPSGENSCDRAAQNRRCPSKSRNYVFRAGFDSDNTMTTALDMAVTRGHLNSIRQTTHRARADISSCHGVKQMLNEILQRDEMRTQPRKNPSENTSQVRIQRSRYKHSRERRTLSNSQ